VSQIENDLSHFSVALNEGGLYYKPIL